MISTSHISPISQRETDIRFRWDVYWSGEVHFSYSILHYGHSPHSHVHETTLTENAKHSQNILCSLDILPAQWTLLGTLSQTYLSGRCTSQFLHSCLSTTQHLRRT